MAEKNKIIVCISTRKNKEEINEIDKHIKMTIGCECSVLYCFNDYKYSLSQVYASFLSKNLEENSILVFVHDDVEFMTLGWGRKLLRIFNENEDYGIIGLAGSTYYDASKPWWSYEQKYKLGQVIHRTQFEGTFITPFSPILTSDVSECVVIDGLFISVDPTRISANFDGSMKGFHFYDIDFCLSNLIEGDCKIGVTTEIRVIHNSVGKINEQYVEAQKLIREKYKDFLPIDINSIHKNNTDKETVTENEN